MWTRALRYFGLAGPHDSGLDDRVVASLPRNIVLALVALALSTVAWIVTGSDEFLWPAIGFAVASIGGPLLIRQLRGSPGSK